MAQFQCIYCRKIIEQNEQRSCPACGQPMFEMPYDRREMLRQELRRFIHAWELDEISTDDLELYRFPGEGRKDKGLNVTPKRISKEQDDQRFPDFQKIQNYVCAAPKTEEFFQRLRESLGQIRQHIQRPYRQEYQVFFDNLKRKIIWCDDGLKKRLARLEIEQELPAIELPEMQLKYEEIPNQDIVSIAECLLDRLELLTNQLERFVRENNMYGKAYQRKPKRRIKHPENGNYGDLLLVYCQKVDDVLQKKYIVDILSDGTHEMEEMLSPLWNSILAIILAPVLLKTETYIFPDGSIAVGNDMKLRLQDKLRQRYCLINQIIDGLEFLQDKTEDKLLETYGKLSNMEEKTVFLPTNESEKKLDELIGLSTIKTSIQKIKAYMLANKDSDELNIHMCFYGNPGTGKTEVARILAGILYDNHILPNNKVVEVDRGGLVGQYVGETPQKTMRKIQEAMGGVLFIDEAYALVPKDGGLWDYGQEAIATLLKAMEDYRGKFCVILAGYKNEMISMMEANPGFRSRIQFELDFPNYSREELRHITELMLRKRKYTIDNSAMERILDILDIKGKAPNFANAREVRNILDQVVMCQNLRCRDPGNKELSLADVNQYVRDNGLRLPTLDYDATKAILTGEEELDQLIGLESVKRMVRKIKAYGKRNQNDAGFNLHMCFCGNPGTGKTEVARILSRILHDAGVLDEAKLVETDAHGLLGKAIGETAPKTLDKIKEAMGGVLFIDEAYNLNSSGSISSTYGEEAVSVLLKEMEDHRGQFCVILAGYKNEMQDMLRTNPGFESRIQFTLDFPDYSREELGEIATVFLKKKRYEITDEALARALDIAEYFRGEQNFANARTMRNILDQIIMNQNLRTEDTDGDNVIRIMDVEDYLADEGIDLNNPGKGKRKIGFL